MNHEYSCGAVVFTRAGGEARYVIIRSTEGVCCFPKGHREPGETEAQTALREIREEVGLSPRLLPGFRQEVSYPLPGKPGTMKHVTFFLAEYEGQVIVPQPEEVAAAGLMTYDEAMAALERETSRRLLALARAALTNQ